MTARKFYCEKEARLQTKDSTTKGSSIMDEKKVSL